MTIVYFLVTQVALSCCVQSECSADSCNLQVSHVLFSEASDVNILVIGFCLIENYVQFFNKLRHRVRHTRVHAARIFAECNTS